MKPDLVALTVGDDHASGCLVLPQGSGQPMQIAQGSQYPVNPSPSTLEKAKIYDNKSLIIKLAEFYVLPK